MRSLESRLSRLLKRDPYLTPFSDQIRRRLQRIEETKQRLTRGKMSLAGFASGHEYFGLHFQRNECVFREWAPNATAIFLIGDINKWQVQREFALERISDDGVWEIRLTADKLAHGNLYRLHIQWQGGEGDRIPAYARRVVQDPKTLIFNAQVWSPREIYHWKKPNFKRPKEPPSFMKLMSVWRSKKKKSDPFKNLPAECFRESSTRVTIRYS